MAACANSLKLVEETVVKSRRLIFWGMLIAIAVTLGSSIWAILELAYQYGASTPPLIFSVPTRPTPLTMLAPA
jgi:hypothetical protein